MWKVICPPSDWKKAFDVSLETALALTEVSKRLGLTITTDQENLKLYIGSAAGASPGKPENYAALAAALANRLGTEAIVAAAVKSFPIIITEAKRANATDAQLAYILATAVHESGAGQWMEEWASGVDYEGRADLGNTQKGDGVKFKGRGFVQLTGRNNYFEWSRKLSLPLLLKPELVEDPQVAAKILVDGMLGGSFTGSKLDPGLTSADFTNARRVVNGLDRANYIAAIAVKLLSAIILFQSSGGS